MYGGELLIGLEMECSAMTISSTELTNKPDLYLDDARRILQDVPDAGRRARRVASGLQKFVMQGSSA